MREFYKSSSKKRKYNISNSNHDWYGEYKGGCHSTCDNLGSKITINEEINKNNN